MPRSAVAGFPCDAGRRAAAVVLLAALIAVAAGCGRKSEVAAAEPKPKDAASGELSVLNPQATIDNVKRKLDAAAEQDQKRRDRIEEQMK